MEHRRYNTEFVNLDVFDVFENLHINTPLVNLVLHFTLLPSEFTTSPRWRHYPIMGKMFPENGSFLSRFLVILNV
jgi:hypothetical protein